MLQSSYQLFVLLIGKFLQSIALGIATVSY